MIYLLDKYLPKEIVMEIFETQPKVTDQITKQVDGIFALEGLYPNDLTRTLRQARLDGKITASVLGEELLEYAKKHKSLEGFAESRSWL